jgi:hypothetical protein
MSDLLKSILPAIPEAFFHRIEERMTESAAIARRQAERTPPDSPAHRMRLGTTRYFERGEALRRSAEDVGMPWRYEYVNTHPFILVTSNQFLLGHTKVDHWGDPVEDKEYKQTLARSNPGDGRQLSLWDDSDPDADQYAVVVVLYARPGTGQDETVPMRLGFGVPTRDLQGWSLLVTFEQLFAAYADQSVQPIDKARPVLKQSRQRKDNPVR